MPVDMDLETAEEEKKAEEALGEARQIDLQAKPDLPFEKVVEAALFLANREVSFKELSEITGRQPRFVKEAIEKIRVEYEERGAPVEVTIKEDGAAMQVRPSYLTAVGGLSKRSDLSRKSTRMLALIAKKGKMLQKELQSYFRGEIYEYITELREAGYIESTRQGNTRLLRPTRKFYREFQMSPVNPSQ
ncbi:hypothetical protein COX86_03080 [Candidatus Micrarchaeota archaeon CG_4_10_14_0_2_um_filter_60_11]|nr:MAG: hypothetical protein AUJ16_00285 [Candidatus Micrarchaeota archaeon CG1_02_60_51]PIZ90800.1 MAG: hypothetical protein COX86_03080 [Candidatus Micrarchaeota archaeon CG_4_10_14_0_2_um_filter_60_11]